VAHIARLVVLLLDLFDLSYLITLLIMFLLPYDYESKKSVISGSDFNKYAETTAILCFIAHNVHGS